MAIQFTAAEILEMAEQIERNGAAFYTGMKSLVPPSLGQSQLDAVIREEWKHITFLMELSDKLIPGRAR